MNKPDRNDFKTPIQQRNETLYVRRTSKGMGDYIEYILPTDYGERSITRTFAGDAAKGFREGAQEGVWTQVLKVKILEDEKESRRLLWLQYRVQLTEYERAIEDENRKQFLASVTVNHYPDSKDYPTHAEEQKAYEAYAEYVQALASMWIDGERAGFNVATASYLRGLLRSYKFMFNGEPSLEVVPERINHETGMMTVLYIGANGLPVVTGDLPFNQGLTLVKRETDWQYEWRLYDMWGEPSYNLEITGKVGTRSLEGRVEFQKGGANLAWPSSNYNFAESSEIIAIHTYLFSLASKWEAKLAQERLEAEATHA